MGLVLDLTRLAEGITTLSQQVDTGEFELSWPGLRFRRELEVSGVVARSGHDLDITLRFSGQRQGDCDRCLRAYQHPFSGELRLLGRKSDSAHELEGQDGVVFHDGRHLDLTGELRQAVLIDIPIRTLCAEDCRGLCPMCGTDRNLEPCNCAADDIDPRWDALRRART